MTDHFYLRRFNQETWNKTSHNSTYIGRFFTVTKESSELRFDLHKLDKFKRFQQEFTLEKNFSRWKILIFILLKILKNNLTLGLICLTENVFKADLERFDQIIDEDTFVTDLTSFINTTMAEFFFADRCVGLKLIFECHQLIVFSFDSFSNLIGMNRFPSWRTEEKIIGWTNIRLERRDFSWEQMIFHCRHQRFSTWNNLEWTIGQVKIFAVEIFICKINWKNWKSKTNYTFKNDSDSITTFVRHCKQQTIEKQNDTGTSKIVCSIIDESKIKAKDQLVEYFSSRTTRTTSSVHEVSSRWSSRDKKKSLKYCVCFDFHLPEFCIWSVFDG